MEKFSIKKRIKSFSYAGKGIYTFIKEEHNAWIHLVATVLVLVTGFIVHISQIEWICVILCIGIVLAAEAINTAIERLVNLVSPQRHPIAGQVKDIAAGAVLICAVATAIVGCIIFLPYFLP